MTSLPTYYSNDREVKVTLDPINADDETGEPVYAALIYYLNDLTGEYLVDREEEWTESQFQRWARDYGATDQVEPRPESGMPEYKSILIDAETRVWLKTKWAVCPRCEGRGVVGNPAFDGCSPHELTRDDPDFFDDYKSGIYDVSCPRCQGKRVVGVVDHAACDPNHLKEYIKQVADELSYQHEAWSERVAELRAAGDRDPICFYPDDYQV